MEIGLADPGNRVFERFRGVRPDASGAGATGPRNGWNGRNGGDGPVFGPISRRRIVLRNAGVQDRLSLRSARAQSQEEAQLATQAGHIAHQLTSASSDTDRDKLKTQLSTVLEKQFELRQQRHKKEIESLEVQVKKLRDLVDKRQENRREIIAKRLDHILRESQGLGW